MPARLMIALRWVAIAALILAIALIIARWKLPMVQRRTQGTLSFWRELWARWRDRREDRRERSANLRALRGATALLLDPDEKSGRVMAWRLESLGCRVLREKTGTQGLARASESRPDFVIADTLLPDISAADLYRALPDRSLPVVFVGVLANQWDELHVLGSNVICLGKPYDTEEAAALAGRMLRRGREEDA